MNKLKVLFLGTPDFAVKPLIALINNPNVEVVGVVTNKDKPVGRKQILTPPPVKALATQNGLPVYQYNKIREEGVKDLASLNIDLMITCAFGQILSQEILDIPLYGVYNIHGSLLPKYRGASPIQASVLNGEEETGVTIMKTDIGVDTGDIIYQKSIKILPNETAGELFVRLSDLGAECITAVIEQLISGNITFTKQNNQQATVTKMIKKEHAKLDFNLSAQEIVNKIRAYNPSPIAYALLNGEPFKIYRAEVVDFSQPCAKVGEVCKADKQLVVKTANGYISLLEVQKSGGKRLDAKTFLLGNKISVGEKLN